MGLSPHGLPGGLVGKTRLVFRHIRVEIGARQYDDLRFGPACIRHLRGPCYASRLRIADTDRSARSDAADAGESADCRRDEGLSIKFVGGGPATNTNLYVTNVATVTVYAQGSTKVLRTISKGMSGPEALAFDGSGNLYVANYTNNTVTEYAPGGTYAVRTISQGVSGPRALAFYGSGNPVNNVTLIVWTNLTVDLDA